MILLAFKQIFDSRLKITCTVMELGIFDNIRRVVHPGNL